MSISTQGINGVDIHHAEHATVVLMSYNIGLANNETRGKLWHKKYKKLQEDILNAFNQELAIEVLLLSEVGNMFADIDFRWVTQPTGNLVNDTQHFFEDLLQSVHLQHVHVVADPPYVALIDKSCWRVQHQEVCRNICSHPLIRVQHLILQHVDTFQSFRCFNAHMPTSVATKQRKMDAIQKMCDMATYTGVSAQSYDHGATATGVMPWVIVGDLNIDRGTMAMWCQSYVVPHTDCFSFSGHPQDRDAQKADFAFSQHLVLQPVLSWVGFHCKPCASDTHNAVVVFGTLEGIPTSTEVLTRPLLPASSWAAATTSSISGVLQPADRRADSMLHGRMADYVEMCEGHREQQPPQFLRNLLPSNHWANLQPIGEASSGIDELMCQQQPTHQTVEPMPHGRTVNCEVMCEWDSDQQPTQQQLQAHWANLQPTGEASSIIDQPMCHQGAHPLGYWANPEPTQVQEAAAWNGDTVPSSCIKPWEVPDGLYHAPAAAAAAIAAAAPQEVNASFDLADIHTPQWRSHPAEEEGGEETQVSTSDLRRWRAHQATQRSGDTDAAFSGSDLVALSLSAPPQTDATVFPDNDLDYDLERQKMHASIKMAISEIQERAAADQGDLELGDQASESFFIDPDRRYSAQQILRLLYVDNTGYRIRPDADIMKLLETPIAKRQEMTTRIADAYKWEGSDRLYYEEHPLSTIDFKWALDLWQQEFPMEDLTKQIMAELRSAHDRKSKRAANSLRRGAFNAYCHHNCIHKQLAMQLLRHPPHMIDGILDAWKDYINSPEYQEERKRSAKVNDNDPEAVAAKEHRKRVTVQVHKLRQGLRHAKRLFKHGGFKPKYDRELFHRYCTGALEREHDRLTEEHGFGLRRGTQTMLGPQGFTVQLNRC